jgi:hypothetical protein
MNSKNKNNRNLYSEMNDFKRGYLCRDVYQEIEMEHLEVMDFPYLEVTW